MSIVEMIRIETNRDFKTDKIGRNMENNETWREEAEGIIRDHLNKRIAYYDISMVDKFNAILQHYLEEIELLKRRIKERDKLIDRREACLLGKYKANR